MYYLLKVVGGEQLRRYEFPLLLDKGAFQVGDYFDMNIMPPRFLSNSELYRKFNKNNDFLSYHRIKTAIASASSILHHNTYFPTKSDLLFTK